MKHILVIDDSSSIRAFVRQLLEDGHYSVTEAENGAIGIRAFREGKFDLVITDVYMPVKSGLEVIVNIEKDYPNIKIIVLSDGGKDHFGDYLDVCEALGATCFLSKSEIKDKLLDLVNILIETSSR